MSRAMGRVCVVGVGLSDGPVTPGMSPTMLIAQSFRRALDDAGLEKDDVDGIASAGYGGMHEVMLAEYLGIRPQWLESTSVGGSCFEFHALHVFRAIQAGDVDMVAIVLRQQPAVVERAHARHRRWRGWWRRHDDAAPDARTSSRPGSRSSARTRWPPSGTCTSTAPRPSSSRRSRCRRASTRAAIPHAMYRDPITVDDVLASKLVADPLHKLDCCVISDGGCCIILTTRPRVATPRPA